jgi:hypothetical protein
MQLRKLKTAAIVLAAVMILGTGGMAASQIRGLELPEAARTGEPQAQPPAASALPAGLAPAARLDRAGDPLPPYAVARLGTLRFRHDAPISKVAVSPDGRFLASAGLGPTAAMMLLLWDAETGRPLHRLRLTVSTVAFSPDSKLLASYDEFTMKLRLTNVATGKLVREFDRRHSALPRPLNAGSYLAFLPGGEQLLLKDSREPTVRLLNADTGADVRSFRLGDERFISTALATDGCLLAVGEKGGTVRLWDIATGTERFALQRHTADCDALAFAPDGKTLATGGHGAALGRRRARGPSSAHARTQGSHR